MANGTPPCRASVDAAERYLQLGFLTTVYSPCNSAAAAFCELKHFEAAAVLIGKVDAMAPEQQGPAWILLETDTHTALIEILGEQHVATLAARGAALEIPETVAYLRTETNRVLTAP